MNVSVIICTFNRGESLSQTLASVIRSKVPAEVEWEIVVVDNNSTDHTKELVTDFSKRHPRWITYMFEPRQGKSFALNAGIRVARGEVLAFTDDDVVVEDTWLWNLAQPLAAGNWAGAAGRVVRQWSCPPPCWLRLEGKYKKIGWALVSFELDQEPGALPPSSPPVGANMAFRKEMFAKHGAFRSDLGPQGGDISTPTGISEDSEFGYRLAWAGERLRYEPSATVYHPAAQERLTEEYFLQWWFTRGRYGARFGRQRNPLYGIPWGAISMTRQMANVVTNSIGWLLSIRSHQRFYYKALTWESIGAMKGIREQWPKRSANKAESTVSSRQCPAPNPRD
jgi:glucosyl-dolichyl phosphate glucuronosyltransferase